MMKKSYETPAMEVLSFQPREAIMDSPDDCTAFSTGCTTDGICVVDGQCLTDSLCIPDISGM